MKNIIPLLCLPIALVLSACNDTIEPVAPDPVCLPTVFENQGVYTSTYSYQGDKVIREERVYSGYDPDHRLALEFVHEPEQVLIKESKFAPVDEPVEFVKNYRSVLNDRGWVTRFEQEVSPGQYTVLQRMYYAGNGDPLAISYSNPGAQDSVVVTEYTDRMIRKLVQYSKTPGEPYRKRFDIRYEHSQALNPDYKSTTTRYFSVEYFNRRMTAQSFTIQAGLSTEQASCLYVYTTNEKGFAATASSCGVNFSWQYVCEN